MAETLTEKGTVLTRNDVDIQLRFALSVFFLTPGELTSDFRTRSYSPTDIRNRLKLDVCTASFKSPLHSCTGYGDGDRTVSTDYLLIRLNWVICCWRGKNWRFNETSIVFAFFPKYRVWARRLLVIRDKTSHFPYKKSFLFWPFVLVWNSFTW